MEVALKERSALDTSKSIRESAGATKVALRRLRLALGTASVARTAMNVVNRRKGQKALDPYATPDGDSDSS